VRLGIEAETLLLKKGRLPMRTFMVVAHRTLIGRHLLEHAESLAAVEPTRFYLVVPVRIPDHLWTEGAVQSLARRRLAEGIEVFTDAGLAVEGEVGDANPVYAASTALRRLDYKASGILLSTLPPGISAWLGVDVVARMRREFDLPVTHLVAQSEDAPA
jgi:GABA permease